MGGIAPDINAYLSYQPIVCVVGYKGVRFGPSLNSRNGNGYQSFFSFMTKFLENINRCRIENKNTSILIFVILENISTT